LKFQIDLQPSSIATNRCQGKAETIHRFRRFCTLHSRLAGCGL
jgi:hypothetical protein